MKSTEVFCGDPNRYCPTGSYKPKIVDTGYYSVGSNYSTRIGFIIIIIIIIIIITIVITLFASFKLIRYNNYYNYNKDQALAPIGHYSLNGLLYTCPAGYYGSITATITTTITIIIIILII